MAAQGVCQLRQGCCARVVRWRTAGGRRTPWETQNGTLGTAHGDLLRGVRAAGDGASHPRGRISYACTVEAIPAGARTVNLWLPVPTPTDGLRVGTVTVVRPEGGALDGTPLWQPHVPPALGGACDAAAMGADLRVALARTAIVDAASEPRSLQALKKRRCRSTVRRTVSCRSTGKSRLSRGNWGWPSRADGGAARRVYDFLIDEMTCGWLAPGASVGDVPRMCDSRKGDCTDYDSLFLALCRNRGIPATMSSAFPFVPLRKAAGLPPTTAGRAFYVEGSGWIPIDASEADKHPELRARTTSARRTSTCFASVTDAI